MGVTARFQCQMCVEKWGSKLAKLYPVYPGPDATAEDRAFWESTPNGSIEMFVTNPQAADFFSEGEVYDVEFRVRGAK